MKLSFHFLCFSFCLIGILNFSTQEKFKYLVPQLEEQFIEENKLQKKEHPKKESRKEEEEENESEENEEKDSSEDKELEEEPCNYAQNLSTTIHYSEKVNSSPKPLSQNDAKIPFDFFLQNYPPLYILLSCLKIDC